MYYKVVYFSTNRIDSHINTIKKDIHLTQETTKYF